MTKLQRSLTVTALAMMAAGLASANPFVTVNCTPNPGLGPTELNMTMTCTGLTGTGILPAQVTGITFQVTGAVLNPGQGTAPASTIQLTNNTNSTQSGYAYTDSEFNVTGLPTGVTLPTDTLGNTFGVLAGTCSPLLNSCVSLAGGASQTFNVSGSSGTGALAVASPNWANYESSFNFNVATLTSLTVQFGGGNVTAHQTTGDSVTAQEIISYTTIPEPSTLALMGGGLIGLGILRKRTKKA